jgi:hypothetical protein
MKFQLSRSSLRLPNEPSRVNITLTHLRTTLNLNPLETPSLGYYTRKKLAAHQTRVELKEGIAITRRVYNRNVPDFEDVWGKYGERIETFGYGMYLKIIACREVVHSS